jgi:hypothetical protein
MNRVGGMARVPAYQAWGWGQTPALPPKKEGI